MCQDDTPICQKGQEPDMIGQAIKEKMARIPLMNRQERDYLRRVNTALESEGAVFNKDRFDQIASEIERLAPTDKARNEALKALTARYGNFNTQLDRYVQRLETLPPDEKAEGVDILKKMFEWAFYQLGMATNKNEFQRKLFGDLAEKRNNEPKK